MATHASAEMRVPGEAVSLTDTRSAAYLLVLFSVLVRLPWLTAPILNAHNIRQTQTAMQARNLFRDGFDILHLRVDWLGNTPGYMALEFPTYQIITAVLYSLFGVNEALAKLVSLGAFVVALILVYKIAGRLFSPSIAFWSSAFFAFTPLVMFTSVAVIPDMLALALGLAAFYSLLKWDESASKMYFVLGVLLASLAVLSKATASLPLAFPIGYLLWRHFGLRHIVNRWVVTYGIVVVVPSVVWNSYVDRLNLLFNPPGWRPSEVLAGHIGTLADRFAFNTYFRIGGYLDLWVFGIAGAVLFIFGFIKLARNGEPGKRILSWWFAGILAYYAFYTVALRQHSYYHLPLIPAASLVVGIALQSFVQAAQSWQLRVRALLVVFLTISYLAWWPISVIHGFEQDTIAFDAAQAVRTHTAPDDLVIVAAFHKEYAAPANYKAYPSILYYADRRGWNLGESDLDVGVIDSLSMKGAKYLVFTFGAETESWLSVIPFLDFLRQDYSGPYQTELERLKSSFPVAYSGDHFVLFRLNLG